MRTFRIDSLGIGLVGLAFALLVVTFPPPFTGLQPPFFTFILPLLVSIVAVLFALVGGLRISRKYTATLSGRRNRLTVRIVVLGGAIGLVGAYIVYVIGLYSPGDVIVFAGFGFVVGVIDEFLIEESL